MPFRNETKFDSATLEAMTAAYDVVVARLQLKPEDPRTGKLAALIVQLARAGVTNSNELAAQASAALK